MRILVVDDDAICRLIVKTTLTGFGEIECCNDGAEAVEAFRAGLEGGAAFDLVCMDIMMPNLNGLEALELIRQEEENRGVERQHAAKVIMTTAFGDSGTVGNAFHNLCDAYLVKPIHPKELLSLVECLCSLEPGTGQDCSLSSPPA